MAAAPQPRAQLFEGLRPAEALAKLAPDRAPLVRSDVEKTMREQGCRFTRLVAEPPATADPAVAQVEFLRSVSLFSGVPSTRLLDVAPLLTERAVEAGEPIVREGELGDAMYILHAGTAEVRKGAVTLGRLGPGDILGEYALLLSEPRMATVVATRESRLFRLGREEFDTLLAVEPTAGRSVVQRIARQFIDAERRGRV